MSRTSELPTRTAATFSHNMIYGMYYTCMLSVKQQLSFYRTRVRISTVKHFLFALLFLQQHITLTARSTIYKHVLLPVTI